VDRANRPKALRILAAALVLLASIALLAWFDNPEIHVWYGPRQRYGYSGAYTAVPQRWVNILGHVDSIAPVASLSYSLNGSEPRPLRIGPDKRRLANNGDFNVEINYRDLRPGHNEIVITAIDYLGDSTQQSVVVDFTSSETMWEPGTYHYDWSKVEAIDELAGIVDGHWMIEDGTVRPIDLDYDRLLAIGDLSWRDYTVTVPITFYSREWEGYLSPSNGPGFGILARWRGHQDTGFASNPVEGWSYLGALGWYKWQRDGFAFREGLQLLSHGGHEIGANDTQLRPGITYIFKIEVDSPEEAQAPALYRFKVWPASESEPDAWVFEERGHPNEPDSGSLLLVAHHVDARFGAVQVDLNSIMPVISTESRSDEYSSNP
jgi:hypothetical protein